MENREMTLDEGTTMDIEDIKKLHEDITLDKALTMTPEEYITRNHEVIDTLLQLLEKEREEKEAYRLGWIAEVTYWNKQGDFGVKNPMKYVDENVALFRKDDAEAKRLMEEK